MASLSFEVINVDDDDPELFDESFILTSQVGHNSESSLKDRLNSTSTLNSEPTSVSSIKNDATPEEIHAKLNNLIKQNSELKEKMQNSNKLIQNQLAVIEAWPHDIMQMNQRHQDLLRQLSDENEKLRKEKADLQKLIPNTEENPTICLRCDTFGDKVMKLETEIDSLVTVQKENFAGVLKQKSVIQEFKESIQRVQNELQIENKYLDDTKQNSIELSCCSVLTSNDGESDRVKDAVQHHEDFESENIELHPKLSEEKQKCEDLEKSLKQKEEQIQILQYAFENSNRKEKIHVQLLMELDSVKQKLAAALNDLSEAQEKCEDLTAKADHYKEQVHILEESDAKIIEKLQIELKTLQASLDEVTHEHNSNKRNLELELEKLSEERDQLLKRISGLERDIDEMGIKSELMFQVHQEELDSVVARLVDAEQKLEEAQDKKVSSGPKDSQNGRRWNESQSVKSEGQCHDEKRCGKDRAPRCFRCPHCLSEFSTSELFSNHVENCCGLEYV